jgi:hypothetical protein
VSRARLVLWGVPVLLWAAFFAWYTNLSGPMTAAEVEAVVARLSAEGRDPVRIATLRRFMEEDTGRQFLMTNLLDAAEAPPALPATGPGADADALLNHYMAHMYPELFRRASHPVYAGAVAFQAMDVAGIAGAESWTRVALMRYRSRRDLIEIATNPAFDERHEYKLAALEKTIAMPTETQIYLSDPRWLLALVLLLLVLIVDRFVPNRH